MKRRSDKGQARAERLKALRRHVLYRAGFRCENCGLMDGLDVHHVTKRSQGGKDHPNNLIALCRACHEQTDWPFAKGRLCIIALGAERFECEVIFAADKWEARTGL